MEATKKELDKDTLKMQTVLSKIKLDLLELFDELFYKKETNHPFNVLCVEERSLNFLCDKINGIVTHNLQMIEFIEKIEPLDPTQVYVFQLTSNDPRVLDFYAKGADRMFPERRFIFLRKDASFWVANEEWLEEIKKDIKNLKELQ
jgi:hypothetical protein